MKTAVLTLTRDRLAYTKHCFDSLYENAGCDFDHFIFDQASEDGTAEWLRDQYPHACLVLCPENVGISVGMNKLLDIATDYDAIVKFDNDCELTQPNTLRDVAELSAKGYLLSPRILGLQNPPRPTAEFTIGEERILDVPQIGGIFLAAPAWIFEEFRYSPSNPSWGRDDVEICSWFRAKGGSCGYVARLEAWHYETTDGQRDRYPRYFARKDLEYEAS